MADARDTVASVLPSYPDQFSSYIKCRIIVNDNAGKLEN
jgi:hypothetical protein